MTSWHGIPASTSSKSTEFPVPAEHVSGHPRVDWSSAFLKGHQHPSSPFPPLLLDRRTHSPSPHGRHPYRTYAPTVYSIRTYLHTIRHPHLPGRDTKRFSCRHPLHRYVTLDAPEAFTCLVRGQADGFSPRNCSPTEEDKATATRQRRQGNGTGNCAFP